MASSQRQHGETEAVAPPEAALTPQEAPQPAHATPAQLAGAMDGQMVARLQRSSGNAAVARLMQGDPGSTRVERFPFRVSIKRAVTTSADAAPVAPAARLDAEPGAEHGDELRGLFESLGAGVPAQVPQPPGAGAAAAPAGAAVPSGAGATPAPGGAEVAQAPPASEGAGAPIRVPDIEVPLLATLGKSDAIAGAFTYTGSINRGGAAPSGFGVTRSFSSKLTGITITPKPSTFDVAATFEHPITWQVRSGTGPRGQKDIASETDAKITKTNYTVVSSDLTPNMSDLNGRPPRTKFWAEDLTIRHEKVHADDDKKNGPAAMDTVKTWLNGQTASDEAGVRTHLGKLPTRFAAALLAALSTEDGEKHAYGDGAPSYKARADKVKEKGDKGDYA